MPEFYSLDLSLIALMTGLLKYLSKSVLHSIFEKEYIELMSSKNKELYKTI